MKALLPHPYLVLYLLIFFISKQGKAQFFTEAFEVAIQRSNSYQYEEKYDSAGIALEQAMEAFGGQFPSASLYKSAAVIWINAGQEDKAIWHLQQFTQRGWISISSLESDTSLNSLHPHPAWDTIILNVADKEQRYGAVIKQLEEIKLSDQVFRRIDGCIKEEFVDDQDAQRYFRTLIRQQDSINLVRVEAIITKYGWLGIGQVGTRGNSTLWQVIQHAPLAIQEKYLPLIRRSVRAGQTMPDQLAILEDRILTDSGKPQRYGSQLMRIEDQMRIFPVMDSETINERRNAIGLSRIENYLSLYGIAEDDITEEFLTDYSVLEYHLNQQKMNKEKE